MLRLILKYLHFIPDNLIQLIPLNNKNFTKTQQIFGIVEYRLEYEGDNLEAFTLPLLLTISQILKEIRKLLIEKKVVSIFSVIILHTQDDLKFEHTLEDVQNLYNLNNIDQWPTKFFDNLIKKLELYSSFKKISFIIGVRPVKKD